MHHEPVMVSEVLSLLRPKPGECCADLTIGLGGHAAALLEAASPSGTLTGLDVDEENLAEARERLAFFGDRAALFHGNFRDAAQLLPPVDVVLADLGVSSPHLDDPERGFSFRFDGPLDLRLDRSSGRSAAAWIADQDEDSLTRALREFGELRGAHRLAVRMLEGSPQTTTALRRIVEDVYRWRAPHVMAQVFQALRIAVNDEMGALTSLLEAIPSLLLAGGRCGIITFHSLEDRIVKNAFRSLATPARDSATGQDVAPAAFRLLTKKPLTPSAEEILRNSRSRSAKLRAVERAS